MNAEKEVTAVLKRMFIVITHLAAMSVSVRRVTHGQKMEPTARVNHAMYITTQIQTYTHTHVHTQRENHLFRYYVCYLTFWLVKISWLVF